jgi:hypothetical protein
MATAACDRPGGWMAGINFKNLDLNLLTVFEPIYSAGNIGRLLPPFGVSVPPVFSFFPSILMVGPAETICSAMGVPSLANVLLTTLMMMLSHALDIPILPVLSCARKLFYRSAQPIRAKHLGEILRLNSRYSPTE